MKAALKYPVFYLAPAEHMVYVFWREENVTTRRQLAEANGWAGQESVDASGRRYMIRRCRETGPVGLYGRIGPADRRTVRYDTDFEEEVRDCPLPELQAWIAREYPKSEWFRVACWRNAADFRQAVYGCRSFEELARMFRCRPEEEPSIQRDLVRFLNHADVIRRMVLANGGNQLIIQYLRTRKIRRRFNFLIQLFYFIQISHICLLTLP